MDGLWSNATFAVKAPSIGRFKRISPFAANALNGNTTGICQIRKSGLVAKKPETLFRERILPFLRALPNTYVETVQQAAIRGSHDIYMCVNGLFISLELKKDEKASASALQEYKANQIKLCGGISFVVYPENWQDIYSKLQHLSRRGNVHIDIFGANES